MTNVLHLTESNFVSTIESVDLPVVVLFKAPWCGPCKVLAPIVEKVFEESQGSFVLAFVDAEEHPALAKSEGLRKFPTMILYKNGKEVKRVEGLIPKIQVVAFVA